MPNNERTKISGDEGERLDCAKEKGRWNKGFSSPCGANIFLTLFDLSSAVDLETFFLFFKL